MNKQLYHKLTTTPSRVEPSDIPVNLSSPEGDSWCEFLMGFGDLNILKEIPRETADRLADILLTEHEETGGFFLPEVWTLDVSDHLKTRFISHLATLPLPPSDPDTAAVMDALISLLEGNNLLPRGNSIPKEAMDIILSMVDRLILIDSGKKEENYPAYVTPDIFHNLSCPPNLLKDILLDPGKLPFPMPPQLLEECRWGASRNPSTPAETLMDLLLSKKPDDPSWQAAIHDRRIPRQLSSWWYNSVNTPANKDFIKTQWAMEQLVHKTIRDLDALLNQTKGTTI